jgi:ribosomal protein L11 methyltransferase
LMAIEQNVLPGAAIIDIGTGSGVLAIAALQLGARRASGTDLDEAALAAARENFELNRLASQLVVGSANCLRDGCSDLTIANISGTVLLGMLDDLRRITAPAGCLILTGFPESELAVFQRLLPGCAVTQMNEWRCVVAKIFKELAQNAS